MKGTEPMKGIKLIAATGAACWLSGCASAPNFAIDQPVGPAPGSPVIASSHGYLEVYSAHREEPITDNFTEWQRNYNVGRYPVAYELAHTSYIVRNGNGTIVEEVRNARNANDPRPKRVALPPGRYHVEAEAQGPGGPMMAVLLPVVIKPGKTTVAHLAGHWKPEVPFTDGEVIRLPDGQIAGWLAQP